MNSKVLFIVEGENDEAEFIRYYFSRLRDEQVTGDNISIFRYGCNIYNFYDCLVHNQKDGDFSSLEVLTVLKEAAEAERNGLPLKEDIALLDGSYTDIFLVFDLDNHDPTHSREEKERILNHLAFYFTDSTDRGMLIVDSPMVEAYRDLSVRYDGEVVLNEDIELERSGDYKSIVGERGVGIPSLSKYSRDSFLITSHLHYKKFSLLLGLAIDRKNIDLFNCLSLLRIIEEKKEKGFLPVLGWISLVPLYLSKTALDLSLRVPANSGFHSLLIACGLS